MKTVAVTGPPSVDLSILVRWLNRLPGAAVTSEGRIFSLLYEIFERSIANPWLLDRSMVGVVQQALGKGLPDIIYEIYRDVSANKDLILWGDAHAHYIDPMDKPGFTQFYRDIFPNGTFITVREDPMLSINKLLDRQWVETSWEAADVVARHIAACERLVRKNADAVFNFEIGANEAVNRHNLAQARAIQTWLGLSKGVPIEDLTDALIVGEENVASSVFGADVRAGYEDRLQHWRVELTG